MYYPYYPSRSQPFFWRRPGLLTGITSGPRSASWLPQALACGVQAAAAVRGGYTYPFDDATSPILGIFGAHSGGKTTRTLFTKKLLDEDMSDFITPDNDVLRKARHRGIVAFDNQSSFPKGFADMLSALVTGSGDSKRELYTTDNEYAFTVKRPVIVNGINMPSDRADLLSRFVALEVPPITAEDRIPESRFWAEFEEDRGKLLGAFFDIVAGVLRHRKPLDWAPRMTDWGELSSALYEHMGWGRDTFELDYGYVEGGQHDAALDSLAGAHILEYLYAEFDDGKSVLIKTPQDLWQDVKLRVDLDSRRWFPQSAESFGKEVNRLKQALAYKGFGVDRGSVGRGSNKKRVIKVTRLDGLGTGGDSLGTVENGKTVPTENPIDKPESPGFDEVGTVGTVNPTTFSDNKKINIGRNRKKRRRKTVPTVPTPEKTDESGVDKPKTAGTVPPDATVPNGPRTVPKETDGNGYKRVTRENLEDYLKELEDES